VIRIQQDGLRSAVNPTGCGQGGVEGDRDVQVELMFYLRRRIVIIVQHDDGEADLITVFFDQRLEIWNIKAGAGTVGVEKMEKHRFVLTDRQFGRQVDIGACRDRMIGAGDGRWEAVFPVVIPKDTRYAAEDQQQPGYGKGFFHEYRSGI